MGRTGARIKCKRCGLEVIGEHRTADECLTHLAPRYRLAAASLTAMHQRYKRLEDRLERSRTQTRYLKSAAEKKLNLAARLAALESALIDGGV